MRTARGRLRIWRAARQAAEQACHEEWVGETQGEEGERDRQRWGKNRADRTMKPLSTLSCTYHSRSNSNDNTSNNNNSSNSSNSSRSKQSRSTTFVASCASA